MRTKRLLKPSLKALTVIMLFFLLFFTSLTSQGEEARYFVPSYEGKEMQKVREWEKTWAGKKIDNTSVDQIKELLPESMYNLFKKPEIWGEAWFEIVPYRQIKPTTGMLGATKKYSSACKIGPNNELLNWTAGIPFPNPKTPVEIMYNFDVTDNH
ncbi:unnamed protein product, partial [marine sediment metagenome]